MTNLRQGTSADIPAIAHILVASWQRHYTHFLPASILENLSESSQIKRHTAYMESGAHYVIAEDRIGEVIAFASFGPSRSEAFQADGELYTIYVKENYLGKGVGYQILQFLLDQAVQSYKTLGVFVMKENKFRSFYERNGFQLVGEEEMDLGEVIMTNCIYLRVIKNSN